MFNNIGGKLKGLASLVVIISCLVGGLWLLYSLLKYHSYSEYIKVKDILNEGAPYNAKLGVIYSISLIISGIISSFLIYGFGELIDNTERIDNQIEKIYYSLTDQKGNDSKNVNLQNNQESIKPELTRAELYEMQKIK